MALCVVKKLYFIRNHIMKSIRPFTPFPRGLSSQTACVWGNLGEIDPRYKIYMRNIHSHIHFFIKIFVNQIL